MMKWYYRRHKEWVAQVASDIFGSKEAMKMHYKKVKNSMGR